MNTYDLTIVLDGKTTPAKRKSFTEKLEKMVTALDGKVGKVNDLGEKQLAYLVGKSTTGVYLNFPLELSGQSVAKLNDKIRVEDSILRYLLIRKEA